MSFNDFKNKIDSSLNLYKKNEDFDLSFNDFKNKIDGSLNLFKKKDDFDSSFNLSDKFLKFVLNFGNISYNINVGDGSTTHTTPDFDGLYYNYTPNISQPSFIFVKGFTYIFNRTSGNHPFYISDVSDVPQNNTELIITGDGAFNNGITSGETITVKIPKNYSKNEFYLYCTSHPSMKDVIPVIDFF